MHERRHMLPVWFFIGVLLAIYGVIILTTGITEWFHPSEAVLSKYHPAVWGGVLLLLIGSFYTLRFGPVRKRKDACPPQSSISAEAAQGKIAESRAPVGY
jgi:hypothetical protein